MKLRRFQTRLDTDEQEPFTLSFDKPRDFDSNSFSILIGPNGTRKSRTLRDILDISLLRSRDSGVTQEGKLGSIEFWRSARAPSVTGISRVLAISGVATDRFPSRISGKRTRSRPMTYAYVGPRSENNLVSRTQSINQIARSLLDQSDRIKNRHQQLRHAFSLLQLSHGILFTLEPTDAPSGMAWTIGALKKRLLMSFPDETDRSVEASADLVKRCLAILKSPEPIEFRLDLDDVVRIDATSDDLHAMSILMTVGVLTVTESYVYTADSRRMDLSDFSSGQWHILASLLFAAVAIEDNALVLIDEPENSLHPAWQQQFLPLLKATISSAKGVHVLVATHSPLVAASLDPEDAEVFRIFSVKGRLLARQLLAGPFGWSADQVLQDVFGLYSARSVAFTQNMDGALNLMARGQRKNPRLIKLVNSLSKTLPTLPKDDATREIIETLISVVNAPKQHG